MSDSDDAQNTDEAQATQLHPVVPPQVSHFKQVPLRTMVKLPQSGQDSPT